jgi:hypothetical protein
MSSSIASITPQTAPRDHEGLKKAGIFQLRTLIERLNGLSTEEQKMAFARMSVDEKVVLALQLLQQFDRANPGAAQQMQAPPPQHMNGQMNGAGAMPAPMASVSMPFQGQQVATMPGQQAPQQQMPAFSGFPQQGGGFQQHPQGLAPMQMGQQPLPMQGAPQVAMIDPASLAAASAAASPAPTATGRQPRNKKTDDQPDLGEKVLNVLTGLAQTVQASTEATTSVIKEITGALDELRKDSPKEQLKGLHESYRGVYQVLGQWDGRLTQLQGTLHLLVSLQLLQMEQTMGAPQDQILQHALGSVSTISAMLNAAPGKG